MELPCGQCHGCRLERSRQWAMRCVHEAQMHENNSFITLTFDDEHLFKRKVPSSLDVRDFQLFMKRLREKIKPIKIRFFHCGEYGDKTNRPHYHAIIFGFDFPDRELLKVHNENKLYTSKLLQSCWEFGFSTVGDMTFESAAYCARYCMKKINGDMAQDHYAIIDPDTGEYLGQRNREYATMSKSPPIGGEWIKLYKNDVYPKDFVTLNGVKMRPPKSYDRYLEKLDPIEYDIVKAQRAKFDAKRAENCTVERLTVREKVLLNKSKQLIRSLE